LLLEQFDSEVVKRADDDFRRAWSRFVTRTTKMARDGRSTPKSSRGAVLNHELVVIGSRGQSVARKGFPGSAEQGPESH